MSALTTAIVAHLYTEHSDMIKKIARREHKGVQTLEVDDIEQHIWLTFTQKSLKEDGKGTDFRTWDVRGLGDLATKAARTYIARERIEFMHFAGAFIYNPAIVEAFLKEAVWTSEEDAIDIDGRVDVKEALKALPLQTQQELFIHYGMDQPFDVRSAQYKRVERAVERISDVLNMGSGAKTGDLADAA